MKIQPLPKMAWSGSCYSLRALSRIISSGLNPKTTKFRPVPTTQTGGSSAWQWRHHQSAASHSNPKTGTHSQPVPTTQISGRSGRQRHRQSALRRYPKTGTLTYPCTKSGCTEPPRNIIPSNNYTSDQKYCSILADATDRLGRVHL